MQIDVIKFVESCTIFQRAKGVTKNQGLYQPLPIPSKPWESVSMDFFIGFPRTRQGFYIVFVIVDRFSKMAHFVPYKCTNDASDIANIFFREFFRIHGLPSVIINDRGIKL